MTDKPTAGYLVGHRKPPVASRFAKGNSGNPSGRPKKTRGEIGVSPFDIVFDRPLTADKDGRPQVISMEEGLQQTLVRKAFAGNRRAMREVMKMIQQREVARAEAAPQSIFQEERYEYDCRGSLNEVLLSLGIVKDIHLGAWLHIKLYAWAVQAALDRRGANSLPLNEAHMSLLIVDGDAVVWPSRS